MKLHTRRRMHPAMSTKIIPIPTDIRVLGMREIGNVKAEEANRR